jgi:hypothetical protein
MHLPGICSPRKLQACLRGQIKDLRGLNTLRIGQRAASFPGNNGVHVTRKGTIKMSEDEIEPMLRMTRTAWDDLLLEGLNSHRAARLWQEEIARKMAGVSVVE